ncbi:unnamed protein product [Protopolystoma xenopodis]|uniref:Transmembrane protein n=1 Tax=Protopolystoma xenopodis TaxID=117903 RepID=A0A3S5BCG3_9PLAT|nr:unnamed protein product [Protopolystoma xenopodis]
MTFPFCLETLNEGKFFISLCCFVWIALLSLWADGLLDISIWVAFSPLWLWKLVTFFGFLVGFMVWTINSRSVVPGPTAEASITLWDTSGIHHIHAMAVSMLFQLLVGLSELLICLRVSGMQKDISFFVVLSPLVLVGISGLAAYIFVFGKRRRRLTNLISRHSLINRGAAHTNAVSEAITFDLATGLTGVEVYTCDFTMELFIAANLIQVTLLIAQLERWIRWNWLSVFIPTYLMLSVCSILCIAWFILGLFSYINRSLFSQTNKWLPLVYATIYSMMVFPAFASSLLLGHRLDGLLAPDHASYTAISIPLLTSVLAYSFKCTFSGPGNPWWFGVKKNVTLLLFENSQTLQLYANTHIISRDRDKAPANAPSPPPIVVHRSGEAEVATQASPSASFTRPSYSPALETAHKEVAQQDIEQEGSQYLDDSDGRYLDYDGLEHSGDAGFLVSRKLLLSGVNPSNFRPFNQPKPHVHSLSLPD